MNRKTFLSLTASAATLFTMPNLLLGRTSAEESMLIKPRRVSRGDVAAIVSPAGSVVSDSDINEAIQSVRKLGLVPKMGKNLGKRWGYLGGLDSERIQDFHDAFTDPTVNVVIPIRGGYGTSRLLPMIDFELIKRHPKAYIGYSDNTSLLLAMNQNSNLVTFHGPNALSDWTSYTRDNWKKVVMNASPAGVFERPTRISLDEDPDFARIYGGKTRGQLIGGNLSLMIQTLGTEWEVDTRGKIIFFEDVNEPLYKIDRMLTHLWLAKKLQVAAGFAIGHITNYKEETTNRSKVDLIDVIRDRFEPLGKPCYVGLTTGHISNMLTLPVGIEVELDADLGYLKAIESAVS
jgi:muramoyltetrapeptide carboxypeptidase